MSYSSVVLGDAPVAYWRLQETSGTTAADASGNGYNGTFGGGFTLGQSAPPMSGTSVLFDGSSGKMDSNLIPNGWTALSVEGWFNFANLSSNNRWVASGHSDYGAYDGFELMDWTNSNSDPALFIGNGSTYDYRDGGSQPLATGTWYHIVATWSAPESFNLYVNGVQSFSGNGWNGTSPASIYATLGVALAYNPSYSGDYTHASMAHVAIYNKALTATQVQNHYNAATGGSSPTPITASGAFQGQGSLSATANIVNPATINATASLTGQGSLSATANLISPVVATASMQGQGSLTATGNGVWLGSASLTGQGSLSSNPVVVLSASASLSGQGSLTAVVELQDTSVIGTANFYGTSSVVSNPTISKAPILATSNMQGQGNLTATVEVIDIGVANLQGTSYLMANAVLPSQVQVPKVWNVVFDPKKSWTGVFDKTVHTWTGVFDPKKVWVGGE